MLQAKFSLDEKQISFLKNHKVHGFKDKSAMVREALRRLKEEMELKELQESADLYSQIYSGDSELQELTKSATAEWPE